MKAVLLFFVLLNVLFYGWSQWVAPPPGGRLTATVEPDAEQLVLFREAYPDIERPAELDVSALELPEPASDDDDESADSRDSAVSDASADTSAAPTGDEPADAAGTDNDDAAAGATGPAAPTADSGDGTINATASTAAPAEPTAGDDVVALAASDEAARVAQGSVEPSASIDAVPASRPAVAAGPDDPESPASTDAGAAAGRNAAAADSAPVTEAPAALRPSTPPKTTAGATALPIGVAAPGEEAGDSVDIARVADDPAQRCVELGPFARLRQATEAAARLRELGLTPSQRLEESEIWAGHWVHLVPYPTRAEAIAVVEMLREGGINDLYIEPSGDMRNAVSLGLFSDVEGAEIRAGRVRRLGVKPQIRDRRRTGTVYWLDLALPPEVQLEPASFAPTPQQPIELNERECAAGG